MDDDENTLDFYGVCDGSEILMNEIDIKARMEESKRRAETQERKLAEQERELSARSELLRQQGATHASISTQVNMTQEAQ